MAPDEVEELAEFLKEQSADLRSVAYYTDEVSEFVYIRDDIRAQYSQQEVEDVINHLWLEAFGKPGLEDVYIHDELQCIVNHFEDAVEMNFLLGENAGVAVAFDADGFTTQQLFVSHCRELLGVSRE